METTRSVPHIKWAAFDDNPYSLDAARVLSFPVTVKGPEGTEATTIRDLLVSFPDAVPTNDPWEDQIVSGGRVFDISGIPFDVELLRAILTLRGQELNAFDVWWQFSDHDHTTDGGQERFNFFVTSGDRIVIERVSFGDFRTSGFDPSVFIPALEKPSIWSSHAALDRALAKENYRRFYTETKLGQLMLLREDHHQVFWFPEEDRITKAVSSLEVHVRALRRLMFWLLVVAICAVLLRVLRP